MRQDWMEEDDVDMSEDSLDTEAPWEVAFKRGVALANDEGWDDEEL